MDKIQRSADPHKPRFAVDSEGHLVVDGESWQDTHAYILSRSRQSIPEISADFWGSSIAQIAQFTIGQLSEHFWSADVTLPSYRKNLADWEFSTISILQRAVEAELVTIQCRIGFDVEFWAKTYSLADLAIGIKNTLEEEGSAFSYWQEDDDILMNGLGVSLEVRKTETVGSLLDSPLILDLQEKIRARLEKPPSSAPVSLAFEFPAAIKGACEQYLMYFGQFLADLGINATTELKEEAQSVLFNVTPTDEEEALEKIYQALQMFLDLPNVRQFPIDASGPNDLAVTQLQANVLHLQSQVMMAKAAIAMQNATLEAKEERIALLQDRLDLRSFQPPIAIEKANHPKEDVISGLVSVKTWDYKFLELNLPEMLRRLKRKFK